MAQSVDHPHPSRHSELQVQHSQNAGFFFFQAALVLVLVSGLRYYVGADYGAYYHGYKTYAASLGEAIRTLSEPGYPLIARIAMIIHDDSATAIFLAALVTIWPAMKVIFRHTDRLLLASLLFIFLGCWHGSFNGVRQYLAATMLFCGYEALERKQFRKYIAWVFLAYLFHRSSIVMIALYFVVHEKINVKNLTILIFATIVVSIAYERILMIAGWITDSEYSLNNVYTAHNVNILRVLAACTPAVVFLSILWNRPKDEQTTFNLNLLIIHAALSIATMKSALLYRAGIYTTLFQVLAISELQKRFPKNTRRSIVISMVILYGIMWWYELSISIDLNHFRWIWNR